MNYAQIFTAVLTAMIGSLAGALFATVRANIRAFRYLKSSQKVLIKDRIVSAHDYFCSKGRIGKYSLSMLEELYQEYLLLGGNGFVTGLMKEIRELPIV